MGSSTESKEEVRDTEDRYESKTYWSVTSVQIIELPILVPESSSRPTQVLGWDKNDRHDRPRLMN